MPLASQGDEPGDQSNSNSFFHSLSSTQAGWSPLSTTQFPSTRLSISVRMKQRYASTGVQTIGSPRTLNEVLTRTAHPVLASNALSNRWNREFVSWCTVWIRAE